MKKVFFMMLMLCTCMFIHAQEESQSVRGLNHRVTINDVKTENNGNAVVVKKDGNLYNGMFWSKDALSVRFTATSGKVNDYIIYYPNRKICMMKEGNSIIYHNSEGLRVQQLSAKDKAYMDKVKKEFIPEGLK